MRRTKIVATVGPSTQELEVLVKLMEKGVDVFRLNFSHGDREYHRENIEKIRQASKVVGRPVAILQDLSGPKIRVTYIKDGSVTLHQGAVIKLRRDTAEDPDAIAISHPEVLDDIDVGNFITMADGTIRLKVVDKDASYVYCEVLNGGVLSLRKGVNFPGVDLDIPAMTEKDVEDLKFGISQGVDIVAVSFVRDSVDVLLAKRYVKSFGGDQPVFAKIERKAAVENIDSIIEAADGIMVARGDLGVEIEIEKIPVLQKQMIAKAIDMGKPVITATQMLTSMINSPFPTRADVSDIANAVLDGTDAVMLSDETTIGSYPVEAVEMMGRVIEEAEKMYSFFRKPPRLTQEAALSYSAVILSRDINADGMVVFTCTGRSALRVARYRPKCPIYACTVSERVLRRLSVVWGVVPFAVLRTYKDSKEMVNDFMSLAKEGGIFKDGDKFVAVLGTHFSHSKGTNTVTLLS